jgi:histone H3/H4
MPLAKSSTKASTKPSNPTSKAAPKVSKASKASTAAKFAKTVANPKPKANFKVSPKTNPKTTQKANPKTNTTSKTNPKASENPVKKIKKTIQKDTTQVKKSHRFHPGTVALRDIRKYQKSQKLLMARLPFGRLVRKVAQEYANENHLNMPKIQFQYNALVGLQEATEDFAVKLFEAANTTALHANRITVQTKDLKLAQKLRE